MFGKTCDTVQHYQLINEIIKQHKWSHDVVLVSGPQLSYASKPISGAGVMGARLANRGEMA